LTEDKSYLDKMDQDEIYNLAEELIDENNELKDRFSNLAVTMIAVVFFFLGFILGIFWSDII